LTARRIKVRGIRREEIDTEQLALVYWLMAKRAVEDKRRRMLDESKRHRGDQEEVAHEER
jgi:hypothetical protein